jgi:hypothetical protein
LETSKTVFIKVEDDDDDLDCKFLAKVFYNFNFLIFDRFPLGVTALRKSVLKL